MIYVQIESRKLYLCIVTPVNDDESVDPAYVPTPPKRVQKTEHTREQTGNIDTLDLDTGRTQPDNNNTYDASDNGKLPSKEIAMGDGNDVEKY